jgi:F-type H+-transporting ATPase subunit alpha
MFADGSKGIVHQVHEDHVVVLHLGTKSLTAGMAAVVQSNKLYTKVGKSFVGRVISVNGDPLDGKGPIPADDVWEVFRPAPPLIERKQLDDQLESGVMTIDTLFPLVLGQRMAILGDHKSGKSTLLTQLALNQKDSGHVVIYAMIAKRRDDVDTLLLKLDEFDALKNSIVIVSTMFDSLIASYLNPYVAVSHAEYLWQKLEQDTIIIYDDLTSHAQAYREISLLAQVSPGRDSYPGDMFYAHSSLLERAGRLDSTGKTLTSLPIVLATGGDVTAFLPTNIMSITDGQYILDMEIFRNGVRPAISTGLSVTRVGGRGQNDRQKEIAGRILKTLASYRQAEEFSHFGSELAADARRDLEKGKQLFEMMTQAPGEYYNLMEQQLLLQALLDAEQGAVIDISKMKRVVKELSQEVTGDENFDEVLKKLISQTSVSFKAAKPGDKPAATQSPEPSSAPASGEAQTPAPEATENEPAKPQEVPVDAQKAPEPAVAPAPASASASEQPPAKDEDKK